MLTQPQPAAVKLITFDLGNVLVKVDHLEFCRRLAVLTPFTPEDIFDYVFNGALEPGYDTGTITSQEFYQYIISQFNLTIEFERFSRWWNSIFSSMPEMEQVVIRLAERYPLFLLSNTNALHFEYIYQNYPLLQHFQEFVLSYQTGSRKPESAIYQHLIRRSGMSPEQILFVDDKMPFVAAARATGMQAWQFTSPDDLQTQLTAHGIW